MPNQDPAARAALEEAKSNAAQTDDSAAASEPTSPSEPQPAEPNLDSAPSDAAPSDPAPLEAGEPAEPQRPQGGDTAVALRQARQQAREERESRRRLEAEIASMRQTQEMMTRQLSGQNQAPQGAPAEDPLAFLDQELVAVPDALDDPEGHTLALSHNQKVQEAGRQYMQQLRQREREQATQHQQAQREAQFRQQLHAMGQQHVQDFMIEQPDYPQALQHLQQSRLREFQALGYDQQQATAQLEQETDQIIALAAQRGMNAASMAYELAKQRGYQAAGAAPAATPAQPNAAQQVQAKAENARQTRSLGAARGGNANSEMTLERYIAMPKHERQEVDRDTLRVLYQRS